MSTKKKKVVYDYQQALDPFVRKIVRLGEHVREHNMVVDSEEVYVQTQRAAELYEVWKRDNISLESDQAWWDFWLYVGEHIRGWWD